MKIEKEKFTALSEKDQNLQLLRVGKELATNIFTLKDTCYTKQCRSLSTFHIPEYKI